MQITPPTWRTNATLGVNRPNGAVPDIDNAFDSIATAGNLLCSLLATFDGDITRALQAYNCGPNASATCGESYATQVLKQAAAYGANVATTGGGLLPGQVGTVVNLALAQLGKPYVFGAVGPDTFDCSGLVVFAFRSVGITLPHYAATQATLGQAISTDSIEAGDLVFTRGGVPTHDLGHVGIAINPTQEVIAPSTGENVQIRNIVPSKVQAVRRILASSAE
jgi:cell wall-associated NlpC family hydrolase